MGKRGAGRTTQKGRQLQTWPATGPPPAIVLAIKFLKINPECSQPATFREKILGCGKIYGSLFL